MSDTISALSSILTIVAILFGLWYPDIKHAIELKLSKHPEDNELPIKNIRSILSYKAIPLLVINFSAFIIFLPNGISILFDSVKLVLSDIPCTYDSAKMAFIVMLLLLAGLSTILVLDIKELKKKILNQT